MRSENSTQYNPTKRLPAIILLVVFLFVAVFFRMIVVMLVEGEGLKVRAMEQWMRDVPTDAVRGGIYDRNGEALALTATRYNVYVRPNDADNKPALARLFGELFGYNVDSVLEKLNKPVSEVTIATRATKQQLNAIYDSGLKGVYYSEDNLRYYPYGDFMTQALGFCGSDGNGQTGLEAYYDKYLSGVNGKLLNETDLVGRQISGSTYYIPSIDGLSVVTTLDCAVQRIVDGAIASAVAQFDPKGALCIVMDYNTGGIVALSEYPSFDLNAVPRDDLAELFSHSKSNAVSSVYEPGSTFKILTAAAALDTGAVSVSDRFYCAGSRTVDGQRIRCWKAKGHGSIDFGEGVEGSCNCVFMDCALRLGTDRFYSYLDAFGLTRRTGIDMTGETSGIFIKQTDVKTVDLARIGFGQAVAVTPIGLMAATSAVVNGGMSVTPRLMSCVKDSGGRVVANADIPSGTRIIKKSTSDTMRELLERVVTAGSGKGAYVPGYRIAGKTGTAQKYANGGVAGGKYISSFLGFSLSEGANYAVLMIVDEPKGYMYYGSLVAAPLVGDIFEGIFNALDIPPNFTGEEAEIIGEPFTLPNFIGMSVTEARNELKKLGLYCEIDGEGSEVLSQYPLAGVTVDKRNAVLLISG